MKSTWDFISAWVCVGNKHPSNTWVTFTEAFICLNCRGKAEACTFSTQLNTKKINLCLAGMKWLYTTSAKKWRPQKYGIVLLRHFSCENEPFYQYVYLQWASRWRWQNSSMTALGECRSTLHSTKVVLLSTTAICWPIKCSELTINDEVPWNSEK